MPKYIYKEFHQVVVSYEDEFDVTDNEKWQMLLQLAEERGIDEEDLEGFPNEPPEDAEVWFQLYRLVDMQAVANPIEDWVTERKGGYETESCLLDDKGQIISSER